MRSKDTQKIYLILKCFLSTIEVQVKQMEQNSVYQTSTIPVISVDINICVNLKQMIKSKKAF